MYIVKNEGGVCVCGGGGGGGGLRTRLLYTDTMIVATHQSTVHEARPPTDMSVIPSMSQNTLRNGSWD